MDDSCPWLQFCHGSRLCRAQRCWFSSVRAMQLISGFKTGSRPTRRNRISRSREIQHRTRGRFQENQRAKRKEKWLGRAVSDAYIGHRKRCPRREPRAAAKEKNRALAGPV